MKSFFKCLFNHHEWVPIKFMWADGDDGYAIERRICYRCKYKTTFFLEKHTVPWTNTANCISDYYYEWREASKWFMERYVEF